MSGYVYLLHFDQPIAPGRHTTQHYVGHAEDLARRIQAHTRGRYNGGGNGCAKLCAVAAERGIRFTVARLWRGGYEVEQRLKNQKNGRCICPICSPNARPLHDLDEIASGDIADCLLAF